MADAVLVIPTPFSSEDKAAHHAESRSTAKGRHIHRNGTGSSELRGRPITAAGPVPKQKVWRCDGTRRQQLKLNASKATSCQKLDATLPV